MHMNRWSLCERNARCQSNDHFRPTRCLSSKQQMLRAFFILQYMGAFRRLSNFDYLGWRNFFWVSRLIYSATYLRVRTGQHTHSSFGYCVYLLCCMLQACKKQVFFVVYFYIRFFANKRCYQKTRIINFTLTCFKSPHSRVIEFLSLPEWESY